MDSIYHVEKELNKTLKFNPFNPSFSIPALSYLELWGVLEPVPVINR